MTTITERFGEGGSNLAPRGTGQPTLAQTLRDICDDLTGKTSATIAAADAAAIVISAADATDLPTALTLVNEIKTAINAQADIFTLANEIKAALNVVQSYSQKSIKG